MREIEIWASPEPTVARIDAHRYRDQLHETGHERRDDDIERIADLGVRATRYPVLWEKMSPRSPQVRDYAWSDLRLARLHRANVEPIVTLLHHGSGPAYTNLLDPAFAQMFAAYAGATAQRYPWVTRWTPINEPLTTARFSTLYGTWYPNRFFDHAAFGRAIVNQTRAIQLAMLAIRATIPRAELMLTEDLQGFTALDDGVADYVEHKAQRRYLSAELVMGRVDERHALYGYLIEQCGVPARALAELRADATPIDTMGWNYYPHSERVVASAGEGRHTNRALLVVAPESLDPRGRLREAAHRLGVPIALSEVHALGTESERVRWMEQRFDDATALREEGVEVRAFGAWAAFGMIDWVSLLTRDDGFREDGIYTFAAAGEVPKATLVAELVRELVGRAVGTKLYPMQLASDTTSSI